jgi:hypothetical protein
MAGRRLIPLVMTLDGKEAEVSFNKTVVRMESRRNKPQIFKVFPSRESGEHRKRGGAAL